MTITTPILSTYKHVFADDPIIVKAQITAADITNGSKLNQLVIRVTCHLDNNVEHVHELPQQCFAGDTLYTDISSALQSEYQLIDREDEPSPSLVQSVENSQSSLTTDYHPFYFKIEAFIRYIQDGDERTGAITTVIEYVYALRGGLKPTLRMTEALTPSAATQAFGSNLTTKPRIPAASVHAASNPSTIATDHCLFEVKNVGDTILESAYNNSTHIVTTQATFVTDSYPSPTISSAQSGSPALIVENNPNRHQLIFRSSLGVLDSFSALSLQKQSFVLNSEQFPVLSDPSYSPTLNVLTQATNPSQKFEMSTGFIPSAWAEWFVREVLTAEYVWLAIPVLTPRSGRRTKTYFPVHLEPADDITIEDLTKSQLAEVKFTAIIPSVA